MDESESIERSSALLDELLQASESAHAELRSQRDSLEANDQRVSEVIDRVLGTSYTRIHTQANVFIDMAI